MNHPVDHHRRGFSLIEMLVVMVIIGALMSIGLNIFGKTAASARRTATDQFTAAVEQARTAAITRRKPIILALAPPIPGDKDQTTRYGLFEVNTLPDNPTSISANQVQRWNLMPDGVLFFGGDVESFRNVLDEEQVQIKWKNGESQASVHVLAFNSRGGLAWPIGSDPVVVKIGTGVYQNGKPIETRDGGQSSMRIGRVVARPWRLDG